MNTITDDKYHLKSFQRTFHSKCGPCQYHFHPKSSTLRARVRLHPFVIQQFEKPNVSAAQIVLYDFTNAFDKLKTDVILRRLDDYNFSAFLVNWIHSFMSDRNQ